MTRFNSKYFLYPEKQWPESREQFFGREKTILKVLGNKIFLLPQNIGIFKYIVCERINVIEHLGLWGLLYVYLLI